MRCSSRSDGRFCLALAVASLVILGDATLAVHTAAASPGTGTDADTITVEVPAVPAVPDVPPVPPTPPISRKRIIIGGSGVRVVDEDSTGTAEGSFNVHVEHGRDDTSDDIVKVGESVYVAPGEVVNGDIVVFGGNAIIEGTVTGTVVVMGGEIRARAGAEIKGDIVAIGGKIAADDDVVIRGEKIVVGGIDTRIGDALDIGGRSLRAIASAFILFIGVVMFFITMLFLRGRIERTGEHMSASFLRSFGAGVLASIALDFGIAIVTIPLIITVVGIPLAVILVLSYVGVFVIACTVFVHEVGRALSGRAGMGAGVFGRLLLGFAVLAIPEFAAFVADSVAHAPMGLYVFLKIVSTVVWLFAYVVGLGAIVLSRFGTRPPVGSEPPVERARDLAPSPAA